MRKGYQVRGCVWENVSGVVVLTSWNTPDTSAKQSDKNVGNDEVLQQPVSKGCVNFERNFALLKGHLPCENATFFLFVKKPRGKDVDDDANKTESEDNALGHCPLCLEKVFDCF